MQSLKISFSSILLFILVVPFIMTYRIGPGETPYWLFGLIFAAIIGNLLVDVYRENIKKYFLWKQIILGFVILATIGMAFYSSIVVRRQTAPTYMIHDIILQQESAIRFLIHGKNPYATSYFGTPLEQWNYSATDVNPALYHFVMEPFYLLFSLPFYFASTRTIGFFDGRMPLFFLFFLIFFYIAKLIRDPEQRMLFIILMAFNPSQLGYTLGGRSDIFMFGFLLAGLYYLYNNRNLLSGIFMALAFAVKQSVWPIFPLYAWFLYAKSRQNLSINKSIIKTLKLLMPFTVVFLTITLPFYFWDQKAFIDSTVLYLSGSTPNSYPISGYGFGMVLQSLGFIKDTNSYYPFIFWQLGICIPVLLYFYSTIKKSLSVKLLIFLYGILLFIFWYFSRYFNNSHVAYLTVVFMTAYFWPTSAGGESEKNIKK
jgi:hypothetical protein